MGRIHRFFFSIGCRLLKILLSLRYKIEVRGLKEALALKHSSSGILFLPNHPAEIDPIILMAIIGPHFFPRSVMVEHFYRLKGFKKILDYARVVPVPSMEEKANKWKKKELAATASYVQEALVNKGENFIIYPSGKLKRSGFEKIGGASFVHTLLSENPCVPAVLVRTTGLWGSSFSVAPTGRTPDFGKTLLFAFKVVLKDFLFFVPKRKVLVELESHPALPRDQGRLEFNRALELWYNNYPLPGEEPFTFVRYSLWGKEEGQVKVVQKVQEEKEVQVPLKLQEEIINYLVGLCKMAKEKITPDSDLSFDLGLDSLDIAEIHSFLDKKYDAASIPLGDLKKVKDLFRAVVEKDTVFEGDEEEAKAFPKWFEKRKRKALFIPEAQTIPEAFFKSCSRMGSLVACADARSGVLSYRKLKVAVLLLAEEFRELPGERVGVLLPSSVAAYMTILALLLAGKVPVMLNWTAGKKSLNHAQEVGEFRVTITSKKFLDKIHLEDLGSVEETFSFLEDFKDAVTLKKKFLALKRSFYADQKILDLFHTQKDPKKTAVLLFTSGSESMPKAVPLSHEHLLSNQRSALPLSGLTNEDVLHGVLPPFHSFGFSLTGILPLLCGLKVFYAPDPTDSSSMGKDIEKMKLTVICLAPSFIRSLFASISPSKLKTVTLVVSGAEKAPPELAAFVREHLPGAFWIEGYGITECSPIVTLQRRGQEGRGVGSPLTSVHLLLLDPDSLQEVEQGQEGEIYIQGPSVFEGYLGCTASSPFLYKEGQKWYKSGDLGYLDEQGCLHITDRLKRTVKIGGEMISLSSVEQELAGIVKKRGWIPASYEAPSIALIAEKKDKPELLLFTVFPLELEEVNHALRESGHGRLVKISKVICVPEIPLMGTGKMNYRRLEEQLEVLV